MSSEPEAIAIPQPLPLPEEAVRRFFRDVDSAGNLEDGMEFHGAGIVLGAVEAGETTPAGWTVWYINPFTAKVEERVRAAEAVVLYEFPQDDGVYWRLWEETRQKLERLRERQ